MGTSRKKERERGGMVIKDLRKKKRIGNRGIEKKENEDGKEKKEKKKEWNKERGLVNKEREGGWWRKKRLRERGSLHVSERLLAQVHALSRVLLFEWSQEKEWKSNKRTNERTKPSFLRFTMGSFFRSSFSLQLSLLRPLVYQSSCGLHSIEWRPLISALAEFVYKMIELTFVTWNISNTLLIFWIFKTVLCLKIKCCFIKMDLSSMRNLEKLKW